MWDNPYIKCVLNVSSGIIVGIEAFGYLSTYKVMKRFLDVNQAKIDMNMTQKI